MVALFIQQRISDDDDDSDGGAAEKREGRVNRASGGTSGSAGFCRLAFPVQRPPPRSTTGPDLQPTLGPSPLSTLLAAKQKATSNYELHIETEPLLSTRDTTLAN